MGCWSCAVHVKASEASCPYCGEDPRGSGGRRLGSAAASVLMGLALAGCPAEDDDMDSVGTSPLYGSPTSESISSSSGDDASTTGGGEGSSSTGMTETTLTVGTSSSTGDTDASSSGSTSISPDYGVPSTGE